MHSPRETLDLPIAVCAIGAGAIHLAAIRSHLGSDVAVASFLAIGTIQILVGASSLIPGARSAKRVAVILVGSGAVAAWAISRTWGLPSVSGHSGAEPVGAADLAAAALQFIALLLALWRPRDSGSRRGRVVNAAFVAPTLAVITIASVHLLAVPPHEHGSAPAPEVSTSRVSGHRQIERTVPVPAATEEAPPAADHVDAPGTTAHSH